MGLINNKSKVFFVIFIIVVFGVITTTIVAMNNLLPIGNKVKSIYAYELVPDNYKGFAYVKNFQSVKSTIEASMFANKFKDNYILMDMKQKYYQNIDLFFVKLNFNLIEFARLINDDFLIGKLDSNYFIIASINFSSQMIFSIVNTLPSQIKEYSYTNSKYYSIIKNNRNIYYSLISDYLVISDNDFVIKKIFDAQNKKIITDNISEMCQNEDIYIRNRMKTDINKYGILPDISTLGLKINTKNSNIELDCFPLSKISTSSITFSKNDFDVLKLFPQNFPLGYLNTLYDVKNTFNNLINNSSYENQGGELSEAQDSLDVFDNFASKVFIGFNTFAVDKKTDKISPELCFIFTLNAESDIEILKSKLKNVVGLLVGEKEWNTTSNLPKNYISLKGTNSEFNITIYNNKYVILSCGNRFTNDIISQITTPKPSLYDKFYAQTNESVTNLTNCSFINTKSLIESLEPSFAKYIFRKINITQDEYNDSFGQFISYLKDKKSISVKLYYDNKKNIYYGKTDSVE